MFSQTVLYTERMSLTETLQLINNTEQMTRVFRFPESSQLALLCQYSCHKDFDSAVQDTQDISYIVQLYEVPVLDCASLLATKKNV